MSNVLSLRPGSPSRRGDEVSLLSPATSALDPRTRRAIDRQEAQETALDDARTRLAERRMRNLGAVGQTAIDVASFVRQTADLAATRSPAHALDLELIGDATVSGLAAIVFDRAQS